MHSIEELDEGSQVQLAGVIAGLRDITTKARGERMATLVLEDFTGQAAITVFPKVYERVHDRLNKDGIVKLTGVVTYRERPGAGGERTIEIRLEDIQLLEEPALDLKFEDLPPPADAPGLVKINSALRPPCSCRS